jgi:hypothetical protein
MGLCGGDRWAYTSREHVVFNPIMETGFQVYSISHQASHQVYRNRSLRMRRRTGSNVASQSLSNASLTASTNK